MRLVTSNFKKSIRCRVIATNGEVKIRFPKQCIGNIGIEFDNGEKRILLRQYELTLKGDELTTERLK